jgi:hypothetical protein
MEQDSIGTGDPTPDTEHARAPRASKWLWRPWHAKLWWGGAGLYWTGKFASIWIGPMEAVYATAVAGWLNILFYPPTLLLVLGLGFVRAWMGYYGCEFGPPAHDCLFPMRSVGGFLDPMANPLDPLSPKHSRRHLTI